MFLPHWPKYIVKDFNSDRLIILTEILEILGNPHREIKNVIHVAGTNGKGSTIAFLAKILQETGHKVNYFTSPHLIHYNECFNLNNKQIADRELNLIIEEVRDKLDDKYHITLFEASFIFALMLFKQHQADYHIFETGLGGRIDPTNLLENKLYTIFTSISLDHQEFLGPNIEAITCEKAYIMRSNVKTIIAAQRNLKAQKILETFAQEWDSPYSSYERDFDFFIEDNKYHFVDVNAEKIYEFALPALLGNHQFINLSTALACLKNIVNFTQEHIKINHAIQTAKISNRLEIVKLPKLNEDQFKNCEIWCDGAHNDEAAKVIATWLKQQTPKTNIILYGRSENKNHISFLQNFTDIVDSVIFFEVQNEPLPTRKNEFLKKIQNHDFSFNCKTCEDLDSALTECFDTFSRNFRIIICGSLYIFRDLKKLLKNTN